MHAGFDATIDSVPPDGEPRVSAAFLRSQRAWAAERGHTFVLLVAGYRMQLCRELEAGNLCVAVIERLCGRGGVEDEDASAHTPRWGAIVDADVAHRRRTKAEAPSSGPGCCRMAQAAGIQGVAQHMMTAKARKVVRLPFGGTTPVTRGLVLSAPAGPGRVPVAGRQHGESRPAAMPEEREPQHTPQGVCRPAGSGGRLRLAPPEPVHLRPGAVHGRADRQVRGGALVPACTVRRLDADASLARCALAAGTSRTS